MLAGTVALGLGCGIINKLSGGLQNLPNFVHENVKAVCAVGCAPILAIGVLGIGFAIHNARNMDK